MKGLATSFAQLAAVIMMLMALAASTALVSQWVDSQAMLNDASTPSQTRAFVALDAKLQQSAY